jgi:hypothetical protein
MRNALGSPNSAAGAAGRVAPRFGVPFFFDSARKKAGQIVEEALDVCDGGTML